MKVFTNEYVVAFDVDDTLVMWDNHTQPGEGKVSFVDPYDGSFHYLTPHEKHVNLLKKYKARGMMVMVWSAGGAKWAEAVINTLKLAEFVDVVITKPSKYVDDLRADEILGQRVYLG